MKHEWGVWRGIYLKILTFSKTKPLTLNIFLLGISKMKMKNEVVVIVVVDKTKLL